MYTAILGAHHGLAMLAVLLTLAWAGLALLPGTLPRLRRPAYIGAMATTGLSGITGLVVVLMSGWIAFAFPWLGLVAVALHGVAGVRGRKALESGARGTIVAALAVQVLTLLVVYWLMIEKPF